MPFQVTIRGHRGLFVPEEEAQPPEDYSSMDYNAWDRPDYAGRAFDKYGPVDANAVEQAGRLAAEKADDYAQAYETDAGLKRNRFRREFFNVPDQFDSEGKPVVGSQLVDTYTPEAGNEAWSAYNQRWNPQPVAATTKEARPPNLTTLERNTALWKAQMEAVKLAETEEEADLLKQQADLTKAWLEKQGKFAPPKPPTASQSETVRQTINPRFVVEGTNVPPFLSMTNRTSRVTGPASSTNAMRVGRFLVTPR
jgi:hypothetical protein